MAERPGKFVGLAQVEDLNLRSVLFEPVRIDLPDAREGIMQWAHIGSEAGPVSFSGRPQRRLAGTATSINFG